uniref:Flagellar protein FliT n=1 Tax=Pseudomonas aeruginosa TaxID=287 RepID=O33423_PSEAI|nr:unknown [Pseudomonas aeruginosa PAK]
MQLYRSLKKPVAPCALPWPARTGRPSGELDQRCRQAVDEAMLDVQDEATLRARMEELLALYRELIDVCQGEQRKLATDLIQLNQSKQGAKVYQMFG